MSNGRHELTYSAIMTPLSGGIGDGLEILHFD
jgi:hypothetical protein